MGGDAGNQGTQDQWGDDGLDQAQEDVAEYAQADGGAGASAPNSPPAIMAQKIQAINERRRQATKLTAPSR